MTRPPELRAKAARILARIVVRKATTDQLLAGQDVEPFIQELVYGSLRHYFSLTQFVDRSLRQPLRTKDEDVSSLLKIGLYQLWHTRVPPHAAINETVAATQVLGKPWAKGLLNAILRNAARGGAPPESAEHPRWMSELLHRTYGEAADQLMRANNGRAPMALRVNRARISPPEYRALLESAGIAFSAPADREYAAGARGWGPETLVLENPMPARELPGYADGLVSIQDAGAQLVAAVLDPAIAAGAAAPSGQPRLLDACAAPGGKLFHLLEGRALDATALDVAHPRLESLVQEAQRLGHKGIRVVTGDGTGLEWWDGRPFDHVLVDAPCSGSGTLRRHPDIKVTREPADLAGYARLQSNLIASLWQTLKPGGTLLYCTCSLFDEENDAVVSQFLASHSGASVQRLSLTTGQCTNWGWQLLPTDVLTDGFYFSHIGKSIS